MATNLNPGADATLVSAAYRAAVADTPGDYSRTLERAADSYEKTMEASSDMWGKVAQVGAAIGGEMMKNAQELTDMVARGATLNPTDTEMFTDEIYGIKDELNALGTFNGQFGDRETRKTRAGLKIKQQELFAEIDNAVANLKVGADAVAAGTFDFDLAGLKDKEKINAIIKSNLKNNVTDNKNIAKLSRDENDELIYTLYDNATGQPTMVDGEPQTMTLKQFNESIATNDKDGGAMLSAFDKFTELESNAGNGALNGTYDPERKQMTLNKLDTLLGDKPVNLKRAMRTPIGYSNTSFYDDLTSQSALSAGLYSTLVGVTGDGSGELIGKVVDGIEDIDNSGGISAEEIRNSGNYNVLVGNITGLKDAKVSKEFFKEYAVKQMEEAYKYGYSKKPASSIKPPKNPFTTSARFDVMDGDKSKTILKSKDELQVQRNQVFNGQPFQGIYGDYYVKDNKYTVDGEPISQYDILINEKLIQPGDDASKLGGTSIGEGKSFDFETHAKSIIGSGSEEQVVANFNSDEEFAGYTFTTEWELGGRAMNISNGEKETIIMLDKSDAWTQIQKFMGENKKQLK